MADTAAEKVQNMNIQEFDGSEFDPFSQPSVQQNGDHLHQELLDDLNTGDYSNGLENKLSYDQDAGIELPNPLYFDQGQGHLEPEGCGDIHRNMSEGEVLGYQDEYGEMKHTGQGEYLGNEEDNDEDCGEDNMDDNPEGQGHYIDPYIHDDAQVVPGHNEIENLENVENDYVENEGAEGQGYPVGYDNDNIDPNTWQPEMTPERSRRSSTPDRSVSPNQESDNFNPNLLMDPERARRSMTPERSMSPGNHGDLDSEALSSPLDSESISQDVEVASAPVSFIPTSLSLRKHEDLSQNSYPLSSETESLDSRSETEGTPKRRNRIPKMKKPLALPEWNDNVVIPPPPRVKPMLIGKQPELPVSPLQSPRRPKTASARQGKDASSDSGVDDETAKSPRKSSADVKKRYGVDSKMDHYKPGGGNVQVFSQKMDTRSVTPRTDTSIPKSVLSPRASKERSPALSKAPTPNTKQAHSKIGSLNNVKHSPGGGNVRVLNAKVDFTNVTSKVGSKDKIDHKPKGGDKKILDQKIEFKAKSKIGSTDNIKHKPGGGDKKIETQKIEFKDSAKSKVGSMDKVKHKPGGGDIRILDEKVDFTQTAKPKVGSMDKVKHQPGGGDKKIETQKLSFKESAKPRTDTGHSSGAKQHSSDSRSESVTSSQDGSYQG